MEIADLRDPKERKRGRVIREKEKKMNAKEDITPIPV